MTLDCRRALIMWPLDGFSHPTETADMSRTTLLRHSSTLIAASVIALATGCDRESPTDVAAPARLANPPAAAALAASAGKPSTSTYEIRSDGFDVASGNLGVVEVLCPAGKRALGGGHKVGGGAGIVGPDVPVYESSPRVTSGTDGWRIEAVNRTAETRRIEAWVVCATI
jgi:hypothetical protein